MRVPTGTLRTVGLPVVPDMLEPRPWPPRSDFHSGLKRKWTRVLWESEERMRMSPPWPPSPPEGPPRGTNFSRRKAMQPLPPSPALIRMWASSMNIGGGSESGTILCASAGYFLFGSAGYFCLVLWAIFVWFRGLSLDEFSGRGTGDWWRA